MKRQLLLLALTSSIACGDDANSNANNDEDLSPDTHECEPYEATAIAEMVDGEFALANDKPTVSITAPADLGGGYIELELTASHTDVIPGFAVQADGDDAGAIIAATAAGTNDTATMRGVFAVAPGQTYNVELSQGANAPTDAYPVAFGLDWSFTSTVDCYEANDTAETARQVPVGTQISAFAMAGYTENSLTAVRFADWYKIVLNRAATVEAELATPPGDHRMRIRFWEADGTTQLANEGGDTGGVTFTTTQAFAARGTYLFSVEVADAAPSAVDGDEADTFPTHFGAKYEVGLREAP